jgi:hypothetical protein
VVKNATVATTKCLALFRRSEALQIASKVQEPILALRRWEMITKKAASCEAA